MRTIVATAALIAGSAGAAILSAQQGRDFDLGVYGAYAKYDQAFNLKSGVGGAARLSYYLTDHIALAADVLFANEQNVPGVPGAKIDPMVGAASLILRLPAVPVYILGGYSLLDFGRTAPYDFTDHGVHGGVGIRLPLGSKVGLWLEGRGVYSMNTTSTFGKAHPVHMFGLAGLSFLQTNGPPRPPRDTDGDGVPDKRDACPRTPTGATVDLRGCPLDSDQDGIYDGLDKCPGTPAGARIDAEGCPLDADKDGVADGLDQCPDTPAGATVNSVGCPSDADHDGVLDGLDKCPDTPTGATVDASGCPIDSDKDGVFDGLDKCPDTPVGVKVDPSGCPLDSDNDGVPDGVDKCPNTPAGEKVDTTGCPLAKDTDGDGVPDNLDQCPGTPPNTPVDTKGCVVLFREERAPTPGAPPRPTLILSGVTFELGRSALKPESYAQLDLVAGSLVANPEVRIEIAGYTDSTGSALVNTRLSNARALAVRAYLARKGVAPLRMVAKGYGPASPVAPNNTAAGRAQNRRVELHKL